MKTLSIKNLIYVFVMLFIRKAFAKKNIAIIGSGNGQRFDDNSKYLFIKLFNDSKTGITPYWITKNKTLLNSLPLQYKNNIVYNYSYRGLKLIAQAKYLFYSTNRSDIFLFGKDYNLKVINLWHGMPIKKIVYDFNEAKMIKDWYTKFKNKTINSIVGHIWEDANIILSTGSLFTNYMKSAFNNNNIYEIGTPRNDVIFNCVKQNNFFSNNLINKSKLKILYMPTHRWNEDFCMYKKPFIDNIEFQKFALENNVVLLYKYHPNVKVESKTEINNLIYDLTCDKYDVQDLIANCDILITDYSSVCFDFYFLGKPVIYYLYDDYKKNNDIYYDIPDLGVDQNYIAKDELQLLKALKFCILENQLCTGLSREKINAIHKYIDSQSIERLLNLIKDISV